MFSNLDDNNHSIIVHTNSQMLLIHHTASIFIDGTMW